MCRTLITGVGGKKHFGLRGKHGKRESHGMFKELWNVLQFVSDQDEHTRDKTEDTHQEWEDSSNPSQEAGPQKGGLRVQVSSNQDYALGRLARWQCPGWTGGETGWKRRDHLGSYHNHPSKRYYWKEKVQVWKLSEEEMIGLNVNQLDRTDLMSAAWVTQRIGRESTIGDGGAIGALNPELYGNKGEGRVVVNFRVCRLYGMLLSEQKVQNRKPFKIASSSLLPDCPQNNCFRTAFGLIPLAYSSMI